MVRYNKREIRYNKREIRYNKREITKMEAKMASGLIGMKMVS